MDDQSSSFIIAVEPRRGNLKPKELVLGLLILGLSTAVATAQAPRGNRTEHNIELVASDSVTQNDHFAAGLDALRANKLGKAIEEFKAGIAIKDDARAEFYLGHAYQRKGDKKSALARYRRALKLDQKGELAQMARDVIGSIRRAEEARSATYPDQHNNEQRQGSPALAGVWIEVRSYPTFSDRITLTLSRTHATFVNELSYRVPPNKKLTGCEDDVKSENVTGTNEYSVTHMDNNSAELRKIGSIISSIYPSCWTVHQNESPQTITLHFDGRLLDDGFGDTFDRIQ